ncbi:hypothetical protein Q8F55_008970 [Vanrija albida]|uniref:Major facilitator superfamily (MFS) profile domain-containing protein n=1 Tax=Vanrija albida TaxID=181172 RepID=A0ABR3PSB7_9TREE
MSRKQSIFNPEHRGSIAADVDHLNKARNGIADYDQVVEDAKVATATEQSMTIREGLRRYPKAIAWSMLLSAAVIMEGFDLVLLGSLYAQPQFKEKFGTTVDQHGNPSLTAAWQTGLSNGAQVGSIIGLALNGILSDRFGYKKTMIGSLIIMIGFIFILFFAKNIQMLLAGEILCGIPWGIFQTLTTAYASEVSPVALRPYLTAYVNLCWVIGQFIASGVLRGMLDVDGQWAYRLPFALQWVWPVPILIGCLWAPESPWWEVRHGNLDAARHVVRRLNTNPTDEFVESQVAMMVHTNALEKSMSAGTQYWDCFKGVDTRRTMIAMGTWAVQALCGSTFMGYSTYFLQQAGLSDENAFNMSLAQYALGFVGTVGAWFLMPHVGRRKIYLYGLIVLFFLLLIIGCMGFTKQTQYDSAGEAIPGSGNTGAQWAIGAMLLVYTAVYDLTVGPVCYALVAEVSSTRLRAKTVVLARLLYNIVGIINNVIMPRFLNPTALNWGAKTGLFWAGFCLICVVWTFFCLPEPKGRTYGELDILFENKVPARLFASTTVDQYAGHSGHAAPPAGYDKPNVEHSENVEKSEKV